VSLKQDDLLYQATIRWGGLTSETLCATCQHTQTKQGQMEMISGVIRGGR